MHDTAMEFGSKFFQTYLPDAKGLTIIDIGAQDVHGSLRSVAPSGNKFVGVDFVPGKGVDVIITDPYKLPFDDESVDVVLSSSCFEHSEFFWLLFLEIQRVLKASGLFYLNVPSNGAFHRYPVDCWRFYPDSGRALERWAHRNSLSTVMLESFTGTQKLDTWNDFVSVFVKDRAEVHRYPYRMLSTVRHTNGLLSDTDDVTRFEFYPEDYRRRAGYRLKRLVALPSRALNYWRRRRG
jgi:SAM-dependent methyltransferase